jgi:arginyl-tRNA synthetase
MQLEEYVSIFEDLKERQPALFNALLEECSLSFGSIKKEGAELNLAYERNEPWAVEILRKMVVADLSGMQETLDTYNIRHDAFDFESELGWEGSNLEVLKVFQQTPYFVAQSACNAQGKPEGAYLDLDRMLKDRGVPQGKKGYQPNYPPLYLLRPDGSTLYVFRDVVYSLKKAAQAHLVLNVIAMEQNVPQEKVALAGDVVRPGLSRLQQHVSYELVKLCNDEGKEIKMSGRRGRYVLADTLYQDLKHHIQLFVLKNQENKDDKLAPAQVLYPSP